MLKMNRPISILLLMALFLVSCKPEQVEEIVVEHPDGMPKIVRYFEIDGQVKELVKEIRYYPNHNKYYEGEFKNNHKDGKWTVWYENGNIWSEGYYKKGLDHGKRTGYYETGEKRFQGKYKDGKMSGIWNFWDENGKLEKEIDYDKSES